MPEKEYESEQVNVQVKFMKNKKKIIIVTAVIIATLLCVSLVYLLIIGQKGTGNNITDNNSKPTQVSLTPTILIVPSVDYPKLTIQNNSTSITDAALRQGFEKYYPYYYYFLGAPNDFDRGLTWVWDNSLKTWSDLTARGIDNFVSATNTVYLGPVSYAGDITQEGEEKKLLYGYMHETAHLFFQYNKVPISYDFGQWLWEGEALLAESLTRRTLGDPGAGNNMNYDINSLLGTMVNGSKQDGKKFNRTISDSNATLALTYMADILSTKGTYDFPSKVNALKVKAANAKGSNVLTKVEYSAVIDEAAGGKTIDGLSASEWLFSQPVSENDGPLGSYLGISPKQVVDNSTQRIGITIYGFERIATTNGRQTEKSEIGFENVPVKSSLYDASSTLIKNMETRIETGGVLEIDFDLLNNTQLQTGVYKMTAEAVYKNKTLTATSFKVYAGNDVVINDNNICFILLNADGTEINTDMKDKITVEGAQSVNTNYLDKGLLIVTANRGDSVTIKYRNNSVVYSKPESTRVIPIKINE